jgi:hypothetical protein
MITAKNEFETVPAFEEVAWGDNEREKAFALINALEAVAEQLSAGYYKELSQSSDEEEIVNIQKEVVDELNGTLHMPPYCRIERDGDGWQVLPDHLPYFEQGLPPYEEVPAARELDVIMVVNDHGNVSCYSWNEGKGKYVEDWGVV